MTFTSSQNPMFRSQFSESIFHQKYAHEGCETWADLARTVVMDVCGGLMPRDEQEQLIQYVTDLKFIPGGRYLYYAGRDKKFFNNCGKSDTLMLTDKGFQKMGDFADGEALEVYSPESNKLEAATMHTHGVQKLNEITFIPNGNHNGKSTWKSYFTEDHKWETVNRGAVTDLSVGDVVPLHKVELEDDELGLIHGLVFADGNVFNLKNGFAHQLRLCGDKAKYVHLFNDIGKVTYPQFAGGDPVVYLSKQAINFKELPATGMPLEYVASFLRGWVEFDGCTVANKLHSTNKEAIQFFIDNAPLMGGIVTGKLCVTTNATNYGERGSPLYDVSFSYKLTELKVQSIEYSSTELVYCPFEPKHNRIVINGGIRTFQCFLLRAEEDTREDWAELSKKSELCLSTGGGIGIDYSIYRPSGSLLRGTGGTASGPLAKMEMINELGRAVMQGGSRRSAIYASLNWKHGDVKSFMHMKDWYHMPVAGSGGQTIGTLKEADQEFRAPMDMTNVSINWDTDWLLGYQQTGDPGELFTQACRQALSTGEPGFSFNFYEKETETLRNACTEVTSSSDSDVCNLGSVNMGRISDLSEFSDVVSLGTKFLLCGTLKADLPYKKVEEVREQNRRLGIGLMGMHEWLIQRGQKYEVTEELQLWLSTYRAKSYTAGSRFAEALSISSPVAYRAIAPTGSIGILAGTTTGIEPVFAVAYKRRYLKGKRWHYQYVIDAAANELIQKYGVDPSSVESSLDLATDYERRIKFQADVQDHVDMSISSTLNLPAWGTEDNNEDRVEEFAATLASYAHRLRGFTSYPDGARGGQPLVRVEYEEALSKLGEEFEEHVEVHDICDITGHGGSCGT